MSTAVVGAPCLLVARVTGVASITSTGPVRDITCPVDAVFSARSARAIFASKVVEAVANAFEALAFVGTVVQTAFVLTLWPFVRVVTLALATLALPMPRTRVIVVFRAVGIRIVCRGTSGM